MIVFDLQCLDGGETFEAWFRRAATMRSSRPLALCNARFVRPPT